MHLESVASARRQAESEMGSFRETVELRKRQRREKKERRIRLRLEPLGTSDGRLGWAAYRHNGQKICHFWSTLDLPFCLKRLVELGVIT